jgi:hypothetical protein
MPVGLTKAGYDWLRCAVAPFDFTTDAAVGIPDEYSGKTLKYKHALTQAFTGTPGRDDYYVVAPTPGVACWFTSVASGSVPVASTTWTPIYYNDCFGAGKLFGDATTGALNRADNVTAFRYSSLVAGIYTTSSVMTTTGGIQVWKIPLDLGTEALTRTIATTPPVTLTYNAHVVSGLDSTSMVPRENFSGALLQGAYSVTTVNQPDFRFQPILENITRLPDGNNTGSGMFGVLSGNVLGMGDFDSIVFKISNPTGSSNSFFLRTASCCEYRPTSDSTYEYLASASPACDPVALALYRKAAMMMPLAVVSAENATFWRTVYTLLSGVATAASYAPGPVGLIGAGSSMVLRGIDALVS